MLPETSEIPDTLRCQACGSPGDPVLLEIPFPAEVLANLGLTFARNSHRLCAACAAHGLAGRKLDLLDLVERAPEDLRRAIHASLINAFEI